MKLPSLSFLLIVFLALPSYAQTPTARELCLKGKAMGEKADIEQEIRLMDDAVKLRAGLISIDTDKFCNCFYDEQIKNFGADKAKVWGHYSYYSKTPPEVVHAEKQQVRAMLLSCFGRQINRSNLTPFTSADFAKAKAGVGNKQVETKTRMMRVMAGVGLFKEKYGQYPSDLEQIIGPSLKKLDSGEMAAFTRDDFKDAWGNDFIYDYTSERHPIMLLSRGGTNNVEDDFSMNLRGVCVKCPT